MRALFRAALALALLAVPAHADDVLVLKDGRKIAVTRLVRRGTEVLFETQKGEHFSVPEAEVVSPPLDSIPRLDAPPAEAPLVLVLKDGRKIPVRTLARRGGEVRFETTKGERFSVAASEVASPALDSIPEVGATPAPTGLALELKDGRKIPVRQLVRRGGDVLFETTKGERFAVPEGDVVSPALSTIPELTPPPAPPAPPEVAPVTPPAPPEVPAPPVAPRLVLPVSAYPLPDLTPLGSAGGSTVRATTEGDAEFVPMPDRWRLGWPRFDRYEPKLGTPYVEGGLLDPYNQNQLKGDYPIAGNHTFLNLNLQSNTNVNTRTTAQAGGTTDQLFYNQNVVAGLELFGGSTVFEPKRWAIRATGVFNRNGTRNSGADFQNRNRIALEEAFVEKRLAVISPNFDAVTLRVGMQNFNSDFRGYLFADNQLGIRLFGNAGVDRHQYNVAWFSMRVRDDFTQLHSLRTSRQQDVFIANWFIQDFATPGYTLLLSVHHNRDDGFPDGVVASNDVAVDPDPGRQSVTYVGVHGDGKWGGWNVSHAFYQAFGTDDQSRATGGKVDVNARMAALELSRDADWVRWRVSGFYASGDDDPGDDRGQGFDAIMENPNLAGGAFMFWTQQAQKAADGTLIKDKFGLLPGLRSKFNQRSGFVNPGLILAGVGLDLRIHPKLKVVTNASWLRFAKAESLGVSDTGIGIDLGLGLKFRPLLSENLFVVAGFSALRPRGGFEELTGGGTLHSGFAALQLAY